MKNKISITLNEKTLQEIDTIIDRIYIRNRSQAIEYLVTQALGENKTAVILSGGVEHKLKIGKDYNITAMVGNRRLVEMAVLKLRENGFKSIFVVARQKVLTAVFSAMGDGSKYGVKISYVEEKESRGTADSLRLLKGKVTGSFLVVYGDIIFSKINIDELWMDHVKHGSMVTLMLTTSAKPSDKGTVVMEGSKVLDFIQKPRESDVYLVFSPIFAASSELLDYSGASLEKNVFPVLAERGLMLGHLSSQKEKHVHSLEDVKNV